MQVYLAASDRRSLIGGSNPSPRHLLFLTPAKTPGNGPPWDVNKLKTKGLFILIIVQEPLKKWYNIIEGEEILPPKILGDYMKVGNLVRLRMWDGDVANEEPSIDTTGIVTDICEDETECRVLFESEQEVEVCTEDLEVINESR